MSPCPQILVVKVISETNLFFNPGFLVVDYKPCEVCLGVFVCLPSPSLCGICPVTIRPCICAVVTHAVLYLAQES